MKDKKIDQDMELMHKSLMETINKNYKPQEEFDEVEFMKIFAREVDKRMSNEKLWEKISKNFYALGMFEGIKLILLVAIVIKLYFL